MQIGMHTRRKSVDALKRALSKSSPLLPYPTRTRSLFRTSVPPHPPFHYSACTQSSIHFQLLHRPSTDAESTPYPVRTLCTSLSPPVPFLRRICPLVSHAHINTHCASLVFLLTPHRHLISRFAHFSSYRLYICVCILQKPLTYFVSASYFPTF